MIEIQALVRRYGAFEALRGLTLSVPGGQVFGLLGPNGAGKSTTLRILATLIRPSGGAVRVGGFDVVEKPDDVRRIIGYVPEGADLYDALTGFEFLELVADLHRLPRDVADERRRPLLESFELWANAGRAIGEYSKGMKQKLLIIAALQHEPRVLLFDEPLDGLDVAAQETLKGVIRRHAAARRRGRLLVAHPGSRGARLRPRRHHRPRNPRRRRRARGAPREPPGEDALGYLPGADGCRGGWLPDGGSRFRLARIRRESRMSLAR